MDPNTFIIYDWRAERIVESGLPLTRAAELARQMNEQAGRATYRVYQAGCGPTALR